MKTFPILGFASETVGTRFALKRGYCVLGTSEKNIVVAQITGIPIRDPEKAVVFVQSRAAENDEDEIVANYTDIWAIRTVAVHSGRITIHVRRQDGPNGWGLQLRLDILVFE